MIIVEFKIPTICRKCGERHKDRINVEYISEKHFFDNTPPTPNYLRLTCNRCGWKWRMHCADS